MQARKEKMGKGLILVVKVALEMGNSQVDVARASGYSVGTIGAIKNGLRHTDVKVDWEKLKDLPLVAGWLAAKAEEEEAAKAPRSFGDHAAMGLYWEKLRAARRAAQRLLGVVKAAAEGAK